MPLRWFGLTLPEVQDEVVHTLANDAIRSLMATPEVEEAFRRWAAAPTTRRSAKAAAAAMPAQVYSIPYRMSYTCIHTHIHTYLPTHVTLIVVAYIFFFLVSSANLHSRV
jgi:hypothetical protein